MVSIALPQHMKEFKDTKFRIIVNEEYDKFIGLHYKKKENYLQETYGVKRNFDTYLQYFKIYIAGNTELVYLIKDELIEIINAEICGIEHLEMIEYFSNFGLKCKISELRHINCKSKKLNRFLKIRELFLKYM